MILNNHHGFSLVEVLVAISIFTVGILGVAQMQYISISADSSAATTTESAMLGQQIVETLFQLDYDSPDLLDLNADGAGGLGSSTPTTDPPAAGTADYQPAIANARYTAYYNILDNSPYTDTKTIRIIVLWNDKSSPKRYSIEFIKAKGV